MNRRAVFFDRDGTIAKDVHYCCRVEDFEILPNAAGAIRLLNRHGFLVVIATNQSGVHRGYFAEETLLQIHHHMRHELEKNGALVDAVYHCPHHPDDGCECRKPKPGLLLRAAEELEIDLTRSFMVGDLQADILAGQAAGCQTVLVPNGLGSTREIVASPNHAADDLLQATQWILSSV